MWFSVLEKGGQSVPIHLVPVMARESMTLMSYLDTRTVQQDIDPVTVI